MISRIIQTEGLKRFAIKRLVRLTFHTAAGHFCCFETFAALRWSSHRRPIGRFLDSSIEKFIIFGGNNVSASRH